MTIIMMMRLLSGTKAIKNARPRNKKKGELMRIAWRPLRWWD